MEMRGNHLIGLTAGLTASVPIPSVDRRAFLRLGGLAGIAGLCWILKPAHLAAAPPTVYCNAKRPRTPTEALAALGDGNGQWAAGKQQHPGEDSTRRSCVADKGQTPFAAILSCSDSRVPPELIFDQGLGDLFVVRVAGNSDTVVGVESLAYGVTPLGALAVLVLGHQDCGAVKAAVVSYPSPAPAFVRAIYPAVKQARIIVAKSGGNPKDPNQVLPVAINQHALLTAERIGSQQPFRGLVQKGALAIAAGVYSLDTQVVTMLTT